MLKLTDQKFKKNMYVINMMRSLIEKVHNIQEQMDIVNRDENSKKKKQNDMLEVNTIT